MTRRRINSIPFVVDVDGLEVPFSLHPQRTRSGNWTARWKLHGVPFERSTRTPYLEAAKRIARQMIRGENPLVLTHPIGMAVAQFEQIQKKLSFSKQSPRIWGKHVKRIHGRLTRLSLNLPRENRA